ncbi:hypothetical protein JCM14244_13280 [Venenivibrio stagnispumantis]|uniref:WG repeat-containing protein n=1 Tax=Venenivibrio stagnispumantis TaxID=407998 RepID=A0AA45WKZ4_9AQUI|nr:hypothetical protein [Venenivibrio stagnispumantis]MCW4573107.1 hypothetical protein [Venenivibrio stagnispumantis]SMP09054.1 hypothetical protein SAMN06264868_10668 [Venenivibrio stagnispumantis]
MYRLEENQLYFYISKDGERVSDYFGWIFKEGLLKNESEYFIATKEIVKDIPEPLKKLHKVKWAIYNLEKKLTPEFDWISTAGLIKSQSPYFKITQGKIEAIYSLEGQVSEEFEKIRDRGVITGESEIFWGKRNKKWALYDLKTGQKLTDDFKSSVIAGAVIGKGNYFVGSYGEEIFYIFDLKSGKCLTKPFDEHKLIEILKHGDLEKAVEELK